MESNQLRSYCLLTNQIMLATDAPPQSHLWVGFARDIAAASEHCKSRVEFAYSTSTISYERTSSGDTAEV